MIDTQTIADAAAKYMLEAADNFAEMSNGNMIWDSGGAERFAQSYVMYQLHKERVLGGDTFATIETPIWGYFEERAGITPESRQVLVRDGFFRDRSVFDGVLWNADDEPVGIIEFKRGNNFEGDMIRLTKVIDLSRTIEWVCVAGFMATSGGGIDRNDERVRARASELTSGVASASTVWNDAAVGRQSKSSRRTNTVTGKDVATAPLVLVARRV